MLDEHFFDFTRRNFLPASVDEFLKPPRNEKVPVGIQIPLVSGPEPTVRERLRISRRDTFVTLDPNVHDQFGFPVAKIQSFLGEPELKTLEFISKKSKEILEASGAKEIVEEVSSYDFFSATHVFGTCRMGNDDETSVVNSSQRVHGIPNLLVTDASVFPTSGGGEAPSLTIEALSLRAADLLLKELKKG